MKPQGWAIIHSWKFDTRHFAKVSKIPAGTRVLTSCGLTYIGKPKNVEFRDDGERCANCERSENG